MEVERSRELTAKSFNKHLNHMVDKYNYVLFVNLMNPKRKIEETLNEELEMMLQ